MLRKKGAKSLITVLSLQPLYVRGLFPGGMGRVHKLVLVGDNNKKRTSQNGNRRRQINKSVLDSSTYQNTENCQYGCLCNKSKKNQGLAEAKGDYLDSLDERYLDSISRGRDHRNEASSPEIDDTICT